MHILTPHNLAKTGIALLIAAILCLVGYIWLHAPDASLSQKPGRAAHLSIDDVEAFGDLITNAESYTSLYDQPLFATLRQLHDSYGAKFTLYTYDWLPRHGYGISEMPTKYKKEFREASDWLRIGFHWPEPAFNKDITVKEFKEAFDRVNRAITNFADSTMIATTLRIHYFFAPDSLLNTLQGVRSLLCADDSNRLSYNLTASEAMLIGNGRRILKNDISYRRTDLRIDDDYLILRDLKHHEAIDTLVVFAHEWKLLHNPETDSSRSAAGRFKIWTSECVNQALLNSTVKWLHKAGYKFSFLE